MTILFILIFLSFFVIGFGLGLLLMASIAKREYEQRERPEE